MTIGLEELSSLTLDGLIRRHRDRARIRVATDAEIAELTTAFTDPGWEKDIIDDWRFITLQVGDQWLLRLLGISRAITPPLITSQVKAIDLATKLVRTNSGSIYPLGARGDGEPPLDQILHVAYGIWMMSPSAAAHFDIPYVYA
jgi:hypothetical protein